MFPLGFLCAVFGFDAEVVTNPVRKIDAARFGSVAALLTGVLGLVERRRLMKMAACREPDARRISGTPLRGDR